MVTGEPFRFKPVDLDGPFTTDADGNATATFRVSTNCDIPHGEFVQSKPDNTGRDQGIALLICCTVLGFCFGARWGFGSLCIAIIANIALDGLKIRVVNQSHGHAPENKPNM